MKIQELTNEAICLGKFTHDEAVRFAVKFLLERGENIAEDEERNLFSIYEASHLCNKDKKIKRYLRFFNNDPTRYLVVSDNSGINHKNTTIYNISNFPLPENNTHNGYTVGKYYVYKKGGTPPKKGHNTYDDAKAEINRIRNADASERCKDFMIFKCVGINYAELEYKEIKGEE